MHGFDLTGDVVWNLLLAFVPVGLGHAMERLAKLAAGHRRLAAAAGITVLGAAWLAFLPNTCYLLTEWRHVFDLWGRSALPAGREPGSEESLRWMVYTLFYTGYSSTGILTFTLAIRPVVRLFSGRRSLLLPSAPPFFYLMAVGVYLGLVLRYNTWDLAAHPVEVWAAVCVLGHRPLLALALLLFAGFLWLAYLAADIWIEGFLCRKDLRGPPR